MASLGTKVRARAIDDGRLRRGVAVTDLREEFFSEAQELLEQLSRDLLTLDEAARTGVDAPSAVNDVFRAVHTLKGLSGLFDAPHVASLAHELEDVLDQLRLGKLRLTREVIDLLFRGIDGLSAGLGVERGGDARAPANLDELIAALRRIAAGATTEGRAPGYDLDPALLGVLTEYEEHRLRSNVEAGFGLFKLRGTFKLLTIDDELEQLKAKARPLGEIITYLPTGDGGDAEALELEVLLASRATLPRLTATLSDERVVVEEIRKKTDAPPSPVTVRPVPMTPRPGDPALTAQGGTVDAHREGELGRAEPIETSLRSVSRTVRVDIRKLDTLMNLVGELGLVRASLQRITERVRANPALRELGFELHRLQRGFDRHLGDLQKGTLDVRMVPLGQVFEKLGRIVRQASREAGKQVHLVITGSDTEIDKLIVEELSDPLMHMVRNAIDHGVERREDRVAVGKPEIGTIAVNAFQKGSHVVIEIEDDGRGIDPARLREAAITGGFVTEAEVAEMSLREVFGLIFLPGFSTKESADMLAGRGVGMDVVKTNLARLGGTADIDSEVGVGTKIAVTLPITLAILPALVVTAARCVFAIPLSHVAEALVHDPSGVRRLEGREFITLRGQSLPVASLSRLFGLDATRRPRRAGFVVVLAAGARRLGLIVDDLADQQDIVVKPLGASLAAVRGFAGAAQLGDQRLGLVLDPPAILDEVLSGPGGPSSREPSTAITPDPASTPTPASRALAH